jgi:hypothetical protein
LIHAYIRGNPIIYSQGSWIYEDGTPIGKEERPCTRCGKMPTKEGYDACLGYIQGAKQACCGHGVEEPYIMY